jgi:hypothetical protein
MYVTPQVCPSFHLIGISPWLGLQFLAARPWPHILPSFDTGPWNPPPKEVTFSYICRDTISSAVDAPYPSDWHGRNFRPEDA